MINFQKVQTSLRDNVITGVLVLAPIGAVLWLVHWLWDIIFSLGRFVPEPLDPKVFLHLENPVALNLARTLNAVFVFALIIFLIWLAGMISRNYIGKKIILWLGKMMSRVPVINSVYSTVEQLVRTFGANKGKSFRRVVYIEYPRKGIYTLALVTGERAFDPVHQKMEPVVNVFVPTTPNPTSGFYLTLSASEVIDSDLTVEAALKEIISLGAVQHDKAPLK